ncbi:MAG: RecX family transcriptional regulator [Clostridia bacterium]|jgi:regulatory protein|nr:RecX family transcriptional regulator [Clostridia bacterium]
MYTPEEFDLNKTQVMKYILYKKRTESEVRKKFCHTIEENMLDDIIEYVKEAGYINDKEYIKRLVNEYMALKSMSIREIKNKIYSKGIYADDIEDYLYENKEELESYELKSAEKLANKKRGMEPQKLKLYLVNKGFDTDTINQVLKDEE